MGDSGKSTVDGNKQPKFLEYAFQKAEEKINTFRTSFQEEHFKWLEEIYEEARKAFSSGDVVLLPKTPSMKRKRKRVYKKKTSHKTVENIDDSNDLDNTTSQSARKVTRASKRVKIGDVSTSSVDLSNILDESSTDITTGGRRLRPRKAKERKPPLPKRQTRRAASKAVVENDQVPASTTPVQKIKVEMKFILEDEKLKTPCTPENRRHLLSYTPKGIDIATPNMEEPNVQADPVMSTPGYLPKDINIASPNMEGPNVQAYPHQFTPGLLETVLSGLHSPFTPVVTSQTTQSPAQADLSGKTNPLRIGTPNSLQPKVAAIVKQFANIEESARSPPSPKKRKPKAFKGQRLSSKFAKDKLSVFHSAKKLRRSSRRKSSIASGKVAAKHRANKEVPESDDSDTADLQHSEEREKRLESSAETKQSHRQTFDINPSQSSFSHAIAVDIDIDDMASSETVPNNNQGVADVVEVDSTSNCSHDDSLKRKTYDISQTPLNMEVVDIPIDHNTGVNGMEEQNTGNKETNIQNNVIKGTPIQSINMNLGDFNDTKNSLDNISVDQEDHHDSISDKDNQYANLSPSTSDATEMTPKLGPKIIKPVKPGNLLSEAIFSFIKKNTPKKETEEDKKRMKEQDMKKKAKMRQRNLEMIEIKRKQEMEERKRRREERERRVAEQQAIRAREEEGKKRALQERMEKERDKEERARKMKEKEEELKRKAREKKQAEAEARRKQEEEERKQKIRELEMEEKRRQVYLARRAEQEEQYRARKAADMKRLEEQKLQEMEQERRLQEDRWRREIDEKAKRREEAEKKFKEEKEKERQRKEKEEREKRDAAEKDNKVELENQRNLYKQQLAIQEREEKERKIAEMKMRLEKERREQEEKQNEREMVLKKVARIVEKKDIEVHKVIGKLVEDNKCVTTVGTGLSGHLVAKQQSVPVAHAVLHSNTAKVLKDSAKVVLPLASQNMVSTEQVKSLVDKLPPRKSSYVNYEIAEIGSDDSTDDDDDPMHEVPKWAQKAHLLRWLQHPDYSRLDPDKIFPGLLMSPVRLDNIFKKTTARFFKRTSSACWDSPILKNGRKVVS